jgi:UDP-glucuronate decarboxylase
MRKQILVTGGAGFIGANLCRRLLNDGDGVVCLDNLYTGRKENLADLRERDGFHFVEHDVIEPFPAEIGRVDAVYNLACPASPPHYQRDKEKTLLTGVLGAKNVLDYALAHGKAPVLHASTSEVYGDPEIHPQTEDYVGHVNPVGPRACYDEGKRAAETLFLAFREKHDLPVKIVRIFNTYGPGMDPEDGRVVSNFIVQALRGLPLTIYGDGRQTRSFCYVDDLIEGFLRVMNDTASDFTGPVNLGNPGEFTVRQLADLVLEMTGGASELVSRPLPADDPRVRRPDIALARRLTGWEPKIPLREGLEKTIAYFRETTHT